TASSPVAASPTTRRLASRSRRACRPARTTQWSSASRMWIGFGAGAGAGRRDRLTVLRIRAPGAAVRLAEDTKHQLVAARLRGPGGPTSRDSGHFAASCETLDLLASLVRRR